MKRIVVSGTTGSGKTTLARAVGDRLDLPFVDLDELHWGPDWTVRDTFRDELSAATGQDGWVVAGNYTAQRDLTWGRADTIVWLDYPAPVVLGRLLRRTLRRIVTGEELFAGNTETVRNTFFSRDSLLVWFFKTHWSKRDRYRAEFAARALDGARLVHLTNPRQASAWLDTLEHSRENE